MAVTKLKGSWWVDFMYNYERLRKRSPLNTKGGAEQFEVHLRQLVAQHGSVGAALAVLEPKPHERKVTFADYAADWLATYVRTNNRASERRTKAGVLQQHLIPHIGHLPLAEVQRRDVETYKAAKLDEKLAPKTINNHLMILGKCLRTAHEDGFILNVPIIKLLKSPPPDFDFLLPIESYQLLQDDAEPMWTEMARLALRTGLRRGELMALDWSDINLAQARLSVRRSFVEGVIETPKNNQIRHLPLTRDVIAMLAPRARPSGLVFRRTDGNALGKSVMGGAILRLCRRTGLRPIGWHVLRHTFASQLAMAGVPIIVIKELMGHSTIQMTMRYAHLAPSTLAQAVPSLLRVEEEALATSWQPVANRTLELTFAQPSSPTPSV